MASVNEIEALNNQIEKLLITRTKIKTQKELLQGRLEDELSEYSEQFGVNLKGASFQDTKVLIEAEMHRVSQVVDTEYELKLKVVKAIESGDYDLANNLLGVKPDVQEVIEEAEAPVAEEGLDTQELKDLVKGNSAENFRMITAGLTEAFKNGGVQETSEIDSEVEESGVEGTWSVNGEFVDTQSSILSESRNTLTNIDSLVPQESEELPIDGLNIGSFSIEAEGTEEEDASLTSINMADLQDEGEDNIIDGFGFDM